ncbi:Aste57867_23412 [Aphanomyces stellatus]|uniref:Aste57867_23412 protein n=1 Tax=Aphanomyces stellatus TaxID=120398 RepID=A0A485LMK2_9STRA|nr:hypothetical protein As57867_023341 [Aphanomyces stellatus]VFU00058.1 Aste57867_23412 [Aphanomyces stellatus]
MSSGDEFDDHYSRARRSKASKPGGKSSATATPPRPSKTNSASKMKTPPPPPPPPRPTKDRHDHATTDGVKWVDDAEAPTCHVCAVPFSLIKRRHHCRQCGNVICSNCSEFVPTPDSKPTRVCTACHVTQSGSTRSGMPSPQYVADDRVPTTPIRDDLPPPARTKSSRRPHKDNGAMSSSSTKPPPSAARFSDHIDNWFMDDDAPPPPPPPASPSPSRQAQATASSNPWASVGPSTSKSKQDKGPQRFADVVYDDSPLGVDLDESPKHWSGYKSTQATTSSSSAPSKYHTTNFGATKHVDQHLRQYDSSSIDMTDDFDMPRYGAKANDGNKAPKPHQYHGSAIGVTRAADPHVRVYDTHIDMSDSLEGSRLSDAFLNPQPCASSSQQQAQAQHTSQSHRSSSMSYVSSAEVAHHEPPPKPNESPVVALTDQPSGGGFAATLRRLFGGKDKPSKHTKELASTAAAPPVVPTPPAPVASSPAPPPPTTAVAATVTTVSTDEWRTAPPSGSFNNQTRSSLVGNDYDAPAGRRRLDPPPESDSWNDPPQTTLWTRGGGASDNMFANAQAIQVVRRDIDPTQTTMKRKDTFDDVFDGPRQVVTQQATSARPGDASSTVPTAMGMYQSIEQPMSRRDTFDEILSTEPPKSRLVVASSTSNPYGNYGSSVNAHVDRFATAPSSAARETPASGGGWGHVKKADTTDSIDFGVSVVSSKDYEYDPVTGTYVAPRQSLRHATTQPASSANFTTAPSPGVTTSSVVDMHSANVIVDKLTSLESELAELKALLRARRARSPRRPSSPPRQSSSSNIFDEDDDELPSDAPVARQQSTKPKKTSAATRRKDSFADLFEDEATKIDALFEVKDNTGDNESDDDGANRRRRRRGTKKGSIEPKAEGYVARKPKINLDDPFGSDSDDGNTPPLKPTTAVKSRRGKESDTIDRLFQDKANMDNLYGQNDGDSSRDSEDEDSRPKRAPRSVDKRISTRESTRELDEATVPRRRVNLDDPFASDPEDKNEDEEMPSLKRRGRAAVGRRASMETDAERPDAAPKASQAIKEDQKPRVKKEAKKSPTKNADEIDALFDVEDHDTKQLSPRQGNIKFENLFASGGDNDDDDITTAITSDKSNGATDVLLEDPLSRRSSGLKRVQSMISVQDVEPMAVARKATTINVPEDDGELPSLTIRASPRNAMKEAAPRQASTKMSTLSIGETGLFADDDDGDLLKTPSPKSKTLSYNAEPSHGLEVDVLAVADDDDDDELPSLKNRPSPPVAKKEPSCHTVVALESLEMPADDDELPSIKNKPSRRIAKKESSFHSIATEESPAMSLEDTVPAHAIHETKLAPIDDESELPSLRRSPRHIASSSLLFTADEPVDVPTHFVAVPVTAEGTTTLPQEDHISNDPIQPEPTTESSIFVSNDKTESSTFPVADDLFQTTDEVHRKIDVVFQTNDLDLFGVATDVPVEDQTSVPSAEVPSNLFAEMEVVEPIRPIVQRDETPPAVSSETNVSSLILEPPREHTSDPFVAVELAQSTEETAASNLDELYNTAGDEEDVAVAEPNDESGIEDDDDAAVSFERKPKKKAAKPATPVVPVIKRAAAAPIDLEGTISLGHAPTVVESVEGEETTKLEKVDGTEFDASWQSLHDEEKQRKQNALRKQRQLQKQKQKEHKETKDSKPKKESKDGGKPKGEKKAKKKKQETPADEEQ